MPFIRGKENLSLFSLRLSVVQLFLPLIFIHLSICRPSVHRSFLRRCATVSSSLPYFSSFHLCRPYSSSARCVPLSFSFHAFVTRERLHEHCVDPIFADPIENGGSSKKRCDAGITKRFASAGRYFLSTVLTINPTIITRFSHGTSDSVFVRLSFAINPLPLCKHIHNGRRDILYSFYY